MVVLKAMGVQSDQEIVSLIGSEPEISDELPASFEQVGYKYLRTNYSSTCTQLCTPSYSVSVYQLLVAETFALNEMTLFVVPKTCNPPCILALTHTFTHWTSP